jgi:hypothetical protein
MFKAALLAAGHNAMTAYRITKIIFSLPPVFTFSFHQSAVFLSTILFL